MRKQFIIIPVILLLLLAYFISKTIQYANGDTEAQREAIERMKEASERAAQATRENSQWYQDELDKFKHEPVVVVRDEKSEKELLYEERAKKFKEECSILANDLTKNASKSKTKNVIESWDSLVYSNDLVCIALGKQLEEWTGKGLDSYEMTNLTDIFSLQKNKAKVVQSKLIQAHLRKFSVNDPILQEVYKTIQELRNNCNYEEFEAQAYKLRDNLADLNALYIRSSKEITWEQFQEISDPTIYKEYRIGLYNILNYIIISRNNAIF